MPDQEENPPPSTPVSTKRISARPDLPPRIAQMFDRRHDWKQVGVAFREWVAAGLGSDKDFAKSKGIPYGSFARHAARFRQEMARAHELVRASTDSTPPDLLEAGTFSSLPSPTSLARGLSTAPQTDRDRALDGPATSTQGGNGLAGGNGPGVVRVGPGVAGLHSRDSGRQALAGASPTPELFTGEAKKIEKGFRGAIERIRAKAPEIAQRLLEWVDRQDHPASVVAIKEALALLKDAEKDSPTASPFEHFSNEEIGMLFSELWPRVAGEREVLVDLKEKKD